MNVDLPQPEGPITAVTDRGWATMLMSRRAWFAPNHAERPETSMRRPSPISSFGAAGSTALAL